MIKRTHNQTLGAVNKTIREYEEKIAELRKIIRDKKYLDATLCKKCWGSGIYYSGEYNATLHVCKHKWVEEEPNKQPDVCPKCSFQPMIVIDHVYHCEFCLYSSQKALNYNDVVKNDLTIIDMLRHFKPAWTDEQCGSFSRLYNLASIPQKDLVQFLNDKFLIRK